MSQSREELLEKASVLAAKVQLPAVRSHLLTGLAEVFIKSGSAARSREILREALQAADAIKKPDAKALQLAWIARVLQSTGESSGAKEQFQRAVLLARAAETPAQTISTLSVIAAEYAEAGLEEEASKVLAELRDLALNPENEADAIGELIEIAGIYAQLQKTEAADTALAEAYQLTLEVKDPWFQAERRLEIAEVYADLGEADKSLSLTLEIPGFINQADAASRWSLLLRLADIYISLQKPEPALQILNDIPASLDPEEPAYSRLGALINAADRCTQIGQNESALNLLKQGAAITGDIENVKDKTEGLTDIARGFFEAGQAAKAFTFANQALELAAALQDNKSALYLLGNLVLLDAEMKNREKSREAIERIKDIVQTGVTRTSGLEPIVAELAQKGEIELALELAGLIHEPEAAAGALTAISQNMS